MTTVRLSRAHQEMLIELYWKTAKTLDNLPYTDDFERLHTKFVRQSGLMLSRHDLWRVLSNLRKAKRLPRKVR